MFGFPGGAEGIPPMHPSRSTRWFAAVLLVASGFASGACADCDMPCCRGAQVAAKAASDGGTPAAPAACPACARAARDSSPASDAPPCRCLIEAREEAPAVATGRVAIEACSAALPAWAMVADPVPPAVAAVAVDRAARPPDRPARILFGVWRN